MVLLLQSGRCYGAEICAILLLLGCPFRWNSIRPKSKFSVSGRKPWTIIRRFNQISFHAHNSSLEGATELKFVPFCSSWDALFQWYPFWPKIQIFSFWPKTVDYSKAFYYIVQSLYLCLLRRPVHMVTDCTAFGFCDARRFG